VNVPLTDEHKICSVPYPERSADRHWYAFGVHSLANMHVSQKITSRFWLIHRADRCCRKIRKLRKKIESDHTDFQICDQHPAINSASKCTTQVGHKLAPVTARSKAWCCCRWYAGIAGSNPAGDMYVCLLLNVVCSLIEVSAMGRSLVQSCLTECDEYEYVPTIQQWRLRTSGLTSYETNKSRPWWAHRP
jgi:hypothetical protein